MEKFFLEEQPSLWLPVTAVMWIRFLHGPSARLQGMLCSPNRPVLAPNWLVEGQQWDWNKASKIKDLGFAQG